MQAGLPKARPLLLPALIALGLSGCATKEFVQTEVGGVSKRIDDLQQLLHSAQLRIDANANSIGASERRIGQAETAQSALSAKLDTASSGLAEANRHIERLGANIDSAGQRIDANIAAIAEANRSIDSIDHRMNAVVAQTAKSLTVLADHGEHIANIESELGVLKTMLPGAAPQAAAPETSVELIKLAALTDAAATTRSDAVAADIQTAATASLSRLDVIAAQIDSAARRIDEHTRSIEAASKRIESLEGHLSSAQMDAKTGQASLADLGRQTGELQEKQAAADRLIADNQAATAAAGKRLDNLDTVLAVAVARVEDGEKRATEQGEQIKTLDTRATRQESEAVQISATAKEGLERAIAAGKLAEGKFVYETQFSAETALFDFESVALNSNAKQMLSAFAQKLQSENKNVFIEIQGHSDASGSPAANQRVSLARAEVVRDYLSRDHNLPLHRMAAIAYGGARPIADNKTREGRAQNRRVQLVVLK